MFLHFETHTCTHTHSPRNPLLKSIFITEGQSSQIQLTTEDLASILGKTVVGLSETMCDSLPFPTGAMKSFHTC